MASGRLAAKALAKNVQQQLMAGFKLKQEVVVISNRGVFTMNKVSSWARIKCAIVFIVLMIFSIGPVPVTSTIGLYVVIFRPNWFKKLVLTIYADKEG